MKQAVRYGRTKLYLGMMCISNQDQVEPKSTKFRLCGSEGLILQMLRPDLSTPIQDLKGERNWSTTTNSVSQFG